jgi:hypothetical protein
MYQRKAHRIHRTPFIEVNQKSDYSLLWGIFIGKGLVGVRGSHLLLDRIHVTVNSGTVTRIKGSVRSSHGQVLLVTDLPNCDSHENFRY